MKRAQTGQPGTRSPGRFTNSVAEPFTADPAIRARLDAPQPCDADGYWWESTWKRQAWTPLGFIRRGQGYWLVCSCGARREAPLQALVDAGKGDMPMHTFRWTCGDCGGREIRVELGDQQTPGSAPATPRWQCYTSHTRGNLWYEGGAS